MSIDGVISVSDEARERGNQAVKFYHSDVRRQWTNQRIINTSDDIRDFLPGGIKKLQQHGGEIVASLLQTEDS